MLVTGGLGAKAGRLTEDPMDVTRVEALLHASYCYDKAFALLPRRGP